MKKFIDKSNLATYTSGKYKGKINWESNIGKELYFEYDDISGYIKFIDYKKSKPQGYVTLQYKNNIISTTTPNLIHLKIPSLFNKEKQSNKFKYNVGDIITKFNENIQVIDQLHITYNNSSARGYKLKCVKCGFEYKSREERLSTCPVCGRKASYSEKFVCQMLIQANINFIPQKEFGWLHNKYYDIYLPDHNAIVEIHNVLEYSNQKIQTYLRLGNKYGMCVYDKQLNMHNHKITNPNK